MEKRTGIAIFGGSNINLKTDEIGKGYILPTNRARRCFGIIIRAKIDGEYTKPNNFIGKRAFWVQDTCTDAKGRKKPSLSLYAKQENLDNIKELPILYLWSGDEKSTTLGGLILHDLPKDIIFQHCLLSNGYNAHWTKQAIILCNCAKKEECLVARYWTSNAGNTHIPRKEKLCI